MRRAWIFGAGLVVLAVVALTLARGGTLDFDDDVFVAPRETAPALDPPTPSTGSSDVGEVGDPADAEPDPPPSAVASPLEASGSSTSLPDSPALYDPRKTGDDLPQGYRFTLRRDEIKPIYLPGFTDAGNVDWPLDTLVIGVAGQTEAKAYPVTHLTSREMVNDTLDGNPILVTW